MKKILKNLIVITLLCFILCSMGLNGIANEESWKLRLSHGLNPEHPYQIASEYFAQLVDEYTNGRVKIEIYPSGQLSPSEREMYESLQMGTLDMTCSTTSPLVNFDPSYAIFDMPFLFENKQHAYAVLDGEFGQQKLKSLENYGIVGLAFWECGFFGFINSGNPIKEPKDLVGRTIRCMETPITTTWIAALGANPVPMAWGEVFVAIQNGTVDGTILPICTVYFNKIYTVANNYSRLNVTYSPLPLTISKIKWDKLPKDIQDAMEKAAIEARDFMRAYTAYQEGKMIERMRKEGVNIVTYTEEEKKQWMKTMEEKAYPMLIPKYFTQEEINKVKNTKY